MMKCCFFMLPAAVSRGSNCSFTSARMYPDRCRPLVPAGPSTVYLSVADIVNPDLFCCRHGFVSTSPTFMRSTYSHPADTHGRLAQNTVNRAAIVGGGRYRHHSHSSLEFVSFGAINSTIIIIIIRSHI